MIGLVCLFLAFVVAPFKSKSRLEAENAVLRHHLIVLLRRVQGRVRLTNNDRWFLIQLYRWFPDVCPAPSVEAVVASRIRAVAFGQIAPWRSRPHNIVDSGVKRIFSDPGSQRRIYEYTTWALYRHGPKPSFDTSFGRSYRILENIKSF